MTSRFGPVQRNLALALAITLLLPLALVLAMLPSPAPDLREHINIGLTFPLYVWKNPPLQSWIVGAVALTGARDGWAYVLVAQAINVIGLVYLVRIARDFIGREAVLPVALAFCGNIYASVFIVQSVLNADQLQGPLWLALFYHLMRGARDNRWSHWLAGGIAAGLAILMKYFVVVFVAAFAIALLSSPLYRRIFLRPGLYVATVIAVAMAIPHFIALLGVPHLADMMRYSLATLQTDNGLLPRLGYVFVFVASLVIFSTPTLLALTALRLRGLRLQWAEPFDEQKQASRVIVVTALSCCAIVVAMALFAGFASRLRYGDPFIPFLILALFASWRVDAPTLRVFAEGALVNIIIVAIGSAVLASLFPIAKVRDPAFEAAEVLRNRWNDQYSCGPAYILGYPHDAHGLGAYYGGDVIGGNHGDYLFGQWIDKERLRRLGAIIVENPEADPNRTLWNAFPDNAPLRTFSLPLRRWRHDDAYVYRYRFVAPQACNDPRALQAAAP